MSPFIAEITGTTILIVLGDGVVANVILSKTKGFNGGLISITVGWAMAVFVGVYVAAAASGAHLNPAVTIALAYAGKFDWSLVPQYIAAQMIGAMLGSLLVWLAYKQHFDETEDGDTKLGVFCTAPAKRNRMHNFLTELIGTFVFMFAVLSITKSSSSLGSLDALPVALVVLAIGLSLGGPTGYAINPARDLGPRIMHFLLPINNKRDSDWGYSWIPVVAPITGALLAAVVYNIVM
ncbi:aquaporin family protein [Panacibacter ginsenosidivorans]|uniref:Aquaporin family protein n=1 Tax=Panacibacter ginsenosidivorans TaxID=1813871 RepID=A0A5B8V9H7_9BACT|nr:MIP/aquaporin family protein [Panacibacter ginsenosidivorans]QEC67795.1 aquaporin family protein [Panacibacter ginsenosidivorans]